MLDLLDSQVLKIKSPNKWTFSVAVITQYHVGFAYQLMIAYTFYTFLNILSIRMKVSKSKKDSFRIVMSVFYFQLSHSNLLSSDVTSQTN